MPVPPKLNIEEQRNANDVVTGYKLPERKDQIEAYNVLRQYVLDNLPAHDAPPALLEVDAAPVEDEDPLEWPDGTGYELSNQVQGEGHGKYRIIAWDDRFKTLLAAREFASKLRAVFKEPRNLN